MVRLFSHPLKHAASTALILCVGISFSGPLSAAQDGKQTFTDALGRRVAISFPPRRIVCLAPDITETLFALGLDDEIVGVTQFSDFPPAAQKRAKVGSFVDLNTEAIIELKPDLILGTGVGNPKIQVEKLERLGFAVFIVYPRDLDSIMETIRILARVVGREQKGKTIADDMAHRIERVRDLTRDHQRPRVFLQIDRNPIFTVSKGSFADDLISIAGGENVASEAKVPYPSYSIEEVILKAPEVIIITTMESGNHSQWIEEWKKWKVIPAVKNKRVYTIHSDLVDRSSPRIIDGLEQIARMLHPEVF